MKLRENKKIILVCFTSLLLGALIILGIRFVTYKPKDEIHYHANFAVYVNGVREQFKGMQYYEETTATTCTIEHVDSPKERAHMHGNVSDVLHVEDHLVTWSNFMQNLKWGLGDDYLKTDSNFYPNSGQGKLTFILNGKKIDTIADTIIQDRDKLLISYGNSTDRQQQEQYKTVPSTALKYDTSKDPAGCGAGHEVKMTDRLKNLF